MTVIRSAEGAERRARLAEHIQPFRLGLRTLSFQSTDSQSAIQPAIVGDNGRALALAKRLREQGMWVTAIRPPTVPTGTARLRLTLTAAHEAQDIDRLLEALHAASE
jgi:8-amino-7-oxononanoate synthase